MARASIDSAQVTPEVSRLDTALALAARALLGGAAVAVLTMTGLVVLSAIMRYVIGSPFAFTEELVALLYLAMVFFTIPIGTIKREHIVVSVGVDRAGPKMRRLLAALATLVMVTFAAWFVVETLAFANFSRTLEARSEQVGILLWPWMAIMPTTMALVGLIAGLQGWQSLRVPGTQLDPALPKPTSDGL